MSWDSLIYIVSAAIASLCFGMLFNIRGIKLIAVAVGGGLGWTLFLLLGHLISNQAINYFIVAVVVSLFAEVMARVLKAPASIFVAPSLIPLVPGAALYYAMRYAFGGDSSLFLQQALDALQYAAALAIGVIASAVMMKLVVKALLSLKERRLRKNKTL
ncbi:MAG: threonine/serine exporter family protein [Clostridia bacterium]|nr:threonine/serine exporter family protein [Clostridia bacterium]